MNLRIPGPTPIPPNVMKASYRQMIGHRDSDFIVLYQDIENGLKKVFQTNNDVLIFSGSGTGGMEATVVNLISPGDRVLVPFCGSFGKRWASIAKVFGAEVTEVEYPIGKSIDVENLIDSINNAPPYKFLFVTHNETSTGVTNDISSLSLALKALPGKRPIFAVDAISSLGAINLPTDNLDLDIVVSASQKALMSPPGLSFVSVSPRAWDAIANSKCPRFYWDFRMAWDWNRKGGTPFTPSVSLMYALQEALKMIFDEGLQSVFMRHARLAEKLRKGITNIGLNLLAEDNYASKTVTSVCLPLNWSMDQLISDLKQKYRIAISSGMANTNFRIAHMGYVKDEDIDQVIDALKEIILEYGID